MIHTWERDAERSGQYVTFSDCPECGARLVSSEAACIITHRDGSSDLFDPKKHWCPADQENDK